MRTGVAVIRTVAGFRPIMSPLLGLRRDDDTIRTHQGQRISSFTGRRRRELELTAEDEVVPPAWRTEERAIHKNVPVFIRRVTFQCDRLEPSRRDEPPVASSPRR
jgi:hypothetical protein